MDLIRDLWRGDVPLVKTYWLFGVVAGIFFNISFTYIEFQSAAFSAGLGAIFVFGFVVFYFAYTAFISFGIWRSANKYQGLQRYAIFAKFTVILGLISLIKLVLEMFGFIPPS